MITVTLGTIAYPFDRLIGWLDHLLQSGVIDEPLLLQHGATNCDLMKEHPLVDAVNLLPAKELNKRMLKSRLVIAHAAQGSTRKLAARNISFVVVPRLAEYKEHVDDHQMQFAEGVAQLGVTVCNTLDGLESAVLNPPAPLNKDLFAGPKLGDYLARKYSSATKERSIRIALNAPVTGPVK